jgi:hypothetical protein
MNELMTKDPVMRESICALETALKQAVEERLIPEVDCPLHHQFAPGAYARTIFIPAQTLVVGKIHKHAHLNMLVAGRVSLATEEGPQLLEALKVMTSKAGTKRVVYTHTDTIWTTIHLTNETDLQKIEDEIIAPSYEALDALHDADVVQLLPLMQQEGSL